MKPDEPKYRWDNPQDWLSEKIRECAEADVPRLVGIAMSLMWDACADNIQNTFQQEMEDDGYFVPMRRGEDS